MTTANLTVIGNVLFKRGNSTVASAYTGVPGEIIIDTTLQTIRIQDGVTAGGHLLSNAANAAVQSAAITALQANAAIQAAILDTLSGNAATQGGALNDLVANAAAQASSLTVLIANAATQAQQIANAGGNTTQLTNGAYQLTLQANGNVTVPGGTHFITVSNSNVAVRATGATGNAHVEWHNDATGDRSTVRYSATGVEVYTTSSGVQRSWLFHPDGSTHFPQYTFPLGAGAPDSYLKSDGAGGLNWYTDFGNVIPAANVTYSLGSESRQWKDLWVSNNTIYIGGTPVRVDSNSLLVNNVPVSSTVANLTNGNSRVSLTGNGWVAFPDGTLAGTIESTGTFGFYNSANTQYILKTPATSWTFDGITGSLIFETNQTISTPDAESIKVSAGLGDNTGLFLDNLGEAELYANTNVYLYANTAGSAQTWAFDSVGGLTLPYNHVIATNNNSLLLWSAAEDTITLRTQDDSANFYNWKFHPNSALTLPPSTFSQVPPYGVQSSIQFLGNSAPGTFVKRIKETETDLELIIDDGSGSTHWTFDGTGNLKLPFDSNIIFGYAGTGMQHYRIGTEGVYYARDMVITTANTNANTYSTWRFGSNGNVIMPGNIHSSQPGGITIASNYDVRIIADHTDNNRTWTFDGAAGELILPGGNVLIDPSDGNFEVRGAQAVNFEANTVVNIYTDTTNNGYQWQFGDDGALTFPTSGNLIFNSSAVSIIDGITNISATGTIGANVIQVLSDLTSFGASPAPRIYGFSSIATTGSAVNEGNISASGNLVASQNAYITGNLIVYGNATVSNIAYTPTTSSDWSAPAPTTIGQAIDRLAAVVKALNNGTGA